MANPASKNPGSQPRRLGLRPNVRGRYDDQIVIRMTTWSLRRKRRQRLAALKGSEILGAARRVFARKGFEGSSVADIASAAGIAKGTIYLYYRSKEAIYFETLARDLREMRERVARRVEAADDFRDKLRAYIEAKVSFCGANRDFFRIYSAEFGRGSRPPERFRNVVRELKEEQLRFLEENIAAAIRSGEIRDVPVRLAAQAISDVTRSLILNTVVTGSGPSEEEVSAFLLDWLWKGLSNR